MYNYHTHTIYCDGSESPENYVLSAMEKGIKILGFSAHAPVSFSNLWSLKTGDIINYHTEIERLKKRYQPKISILNGLEIDYIPDVTKAFSYFIRENNLDFTIGSVHLVKLPENDNLWFIDGATRNFDAGLEQIFNNNIEKAVTAYFHQIQEMVYTQKPNIIGHLDKIKMNNKKRFFEEGDEWYRKLINETLKVIAQSTCIVELNTRGVYMGKSESFFPSVFVLEQCFQLGIPVMINSDAHKPEQLTLGFKEAASMLKDIGYSKLHIIDGGKVKAVDVGDYMV